MGLPRWVVVVIVAAVVVLAIDIAIVVLAHDGTAPAAAKATAGGDAVAMIDPGERSVVANVEVGRQPTAIAAGYGGAWVLNRGSGTLTHIDAKTHSVVSTMEPDATANDITLGAGGVWFVGHPKGVNGPLQTAELERIDPATDAVDRTFETSTGASVIAAGGNALWSTGYLGGHVRGAARSDARSGEMRRINIGIYGDLVTADKNAVYYVASIGNRVARVSTRTGTLTNSMTLAIGREPRRRQRAAQSDRRRLRCGLALDQHHGRQRPQDRQPSGRDPEQHPRLPERARDRLR